VANALKSEGLGPTEIAKILKTSIHNVRYYLQNPGKAIYRNPFWYLKFDRNDNTIPVQKIIQTTLEQKQSIQENMQKYNKN
jgi:predicted transcriptional regulator